MRDLVNAVDKRVMGLCQRCFDKFMRLYAPVFFPVVLFAFVANEFVRGELMLPIIRAWVLFHITLVVLAYFAQAPARVLARSNPNARLRMVYLNAVDRHKDILSLITTAGLEIPSEFPTVEPSAREALLAYNRVPLLHSLTWTIHDHHYLRYSWLRVDKSDPSVLLSALKPLDVILFHSRRSHLGKIVRIVTRCYWDHVATYAGNGNIMHATLQGVRKDILLPFFLDQHRDFAVLRKPQLTNSQAAEKLAFMEQQIGKGFNYRGVSLEFWRIITGKKYDGLLSAFTLSANLLFCSAVLVLTAWRPELRRLQLALLMAGGPYMFDTVYHWVAYRGDIITVWRGEYGKSRD